MLIGLALGCRDRPDGAALYGEHCASCHGADGRGDPRRIGLYPRVDLTRSELVRAGDRPAIYRAVRQGLGAMPGFDNKLELDQLLELTSYTLTFKEQRNEP